MARVRHPGVAVTASAAVQLPNLTGSTQKVDLRWVKAGERAGPLWVIDEGLKPGERVIVEGIQKVKAGMPVVPKPFQEALPAGSGSTPTAEKQPR